MFHLLLLDLPAALRRDSRLFLLATSLFCLSVILALFMARLDPQSVNVVYSAHEIDEFTRMFHPHWQSLLIEQRSNTEHFLFYVTNNGWVAIQIFLSGLLLGAGSLVFMAYIGFSLGLMIGLLSTTAYSDVMWSSIAAHSVFEMLATIIAAVAGLKWGMSLVLLVKPERRHEFGLRFAQSLLLLLNALVVFVLAALIESYWSFGVQTAVDTKFIVGAASWAAVISFLVFYGRVTTKNENG
jgi:uncharacterized membrane protein SpoIIM required for sporulation